MVLTGPQKQDFITTVWKHYHTHGRTMPWREDPTPYNVFISEYMLQQTQVPRVIPKFNDFIDRFPDIATLASASFADVLKQWQGLGYNRRAKFLHSAAKVVASTYDGVIPASQEELSRLPGIGNNTAGAIVAYAYDEPVVFVETNIRTVYFHHFFRNCENVSDRDVAALVEETLDKKHVRQWYWALMDYGTYLKSNGQGYNSKSRHYAKQTPFEGSTRQMRGAVIRELSNGPKTEEQLLKVTHDDRRLYDVLASLEKEKFIEKNDDTWCLTGENSTS